jgi:hypothetical protein
MKVDRNAKAESYCWEIETRQGCPSEQTGEVFLKDE